MIEFQDKELFIWVGLFYGMIIQKLQTKKYQHYYFLLNISEVKIEGLKWNFIIGTNDDIQKYFIS